MQEYSERVIDAFLTCDKVADIARITGLSRATVSRLRNNEDFQRVLTRRKTEIVTAAVNKMQSAMSDAADVLHAIITDSNTASQVRINAASVLFGQCRAWTETADLLRRVQALEDRVNDDNDSK